MKWRSMAAGYRNEENINNVMKISAIIENNQLENEMAKIMAKSEIMK
jgi:hypothetical protein